MQNQKTYNLNSTIIAFFLITRFVAVFFSLPSISDVGYYLSIFSRINEGLIPYKDFEFEYPPLTILPLYFFPKLFLEKPDFDSYFLSYVLFMFIIDVLCLFACRFFCRERLKMNQRQINYMSLLYSLFGLLLFKIIYHRLDLIVALFFAVSLILFRADEKKLSLRFFINSFLGFFYKIVPAFNLPIAIIFKAATQEKMVKKILFQSLIFLAVIILGIFIIELFTNQNFLRNLAFHKKRGVQIESSFASFLLFKNMICGEIAVIYNEYGSWNIKTPTLLNLISNNFGFLALLGFYITLFLKFLKSKKPKISEELFLEATLITVFFILSFQKVLSTQFFIWLIPLSAIWLAKNHSAWFLLLFSFLFFMTFFIFSIDLLALTNQAPILVTMLFLRNLVLIIFTCFLTVKFFKKI